MGTEIRITYSSTLYVLQPLAFFPLPFPPCFPFPLPISSPSFPPSHLQQSSVAIGPLAIYISGFVTMLILRLLNRVIGRYVSLYHKLYSKNAVRRLWAAEFEKQVEMLILLAAWWYCSRYVVSAFHQRIVFTSWIIWDLFCKSWKSPTWVVVLSSSDLRSSDVV